MESASWIYNSKFALISRHPSQVFFVTHNPKSLCRFTTGSLDTLTQTYTPGPGFSWNSLYSDVPTLPGANSGGTYTPPHAVQSFYYLIMNSFLFFFAALYFDKVIPNEFGKSTHVFFFLDPRFWGISFRKGERANFMWLESVLKRSGGIEVAGLDEEVLREKAKAVDPGKMHHPASLFSLFAHLLCFFLFYRHLAIFKDCQFAKIFLCFNVLCIKI